MIVYFFDRGMQLKGCAFTKINSEYRIISDKKSEDVESGVSSFEFEFFYTRENRLAAEELAKEGNYILRYDGNRPDGSNGYSINGVTDFFTIIDSEINTSGQTISIYAEDGGLDLLNDIADGYSASVPESLRNYIGYAISGSGFVVRNCYQPGEDIIMSWESGRTGIEIIREICAQYECEFYFGFDIEGLNLKRKWIDVVKKRGIETNYNLYMNRDIDNIIIKKSIANLATAIIPSGEEDVSLVGYSYDDGDFYVSGNALYSRKALETWSRYKGRDLTFTGHIFRAFSTSATTQSELLELAIEELKKRVKAEINYDVSIVQLPDEVKIGDRINIVDDYGNLYISGRLLKLETSIVNDTRDATLGDYLLKSSGISEVVVDLARQFSELAKIRAESTYTWTAYADDITGKNLTDSDPDSNKKYIGFSYGHTEETYDVSTVDPTIFEWSLRNADDRIYIKEIPFTSETAWSYEDVSLTPDDFNDRNFAEFDISGLTGPTFNRFYTNVDELINDGLICNDGENGYIGWAPIGEYGLDAVDYLGMISPFSGSLLIRSMKLAIRIDPYLNDIDQLIDNYGGTYTDYALRIYYKHITGIRKQSTVGNYQESSAIVFSVKTDDPEVKALEVDHEGNATFNGQINRSSMPLATDDLYGAVKLSDVVSTSTYVHEQTTPSDVWTITHNLNKYPSIVVLDSGGSEVIGDSRYIDSNTVELKFSGGFSGTAYLS